MGDRRGWLRRLDRWCAVYCALMVIGLGLLWWPLKTHRDLDAWERRLRTSGVPTDAVVHDLVIKDRGRRTPSETMFLRYDFAGRARTAEVGCWEACEPAGTPVRIWVNPADPADFVTEFGRLSGHRGRIQGVFGVAGFVLLVFAGMALVGRLRGAARRTAGRPPKVNRRGASGTGTRLGSRSGRRPVRRRETRR